MEGGKEQENDQKHRGIRKTGRTGEAAIGLWWGGVRKKDEEEKKCGG